MMAPPKRMRAEVAAPPADVQLQTHCKTTTVSMKAEIKWTVTEFSSQQCKTKKVGEFLKSGNFHSPGDVGLQWFLALFPNGCTEEFSGNASLFVYLVKTMKSDCLVTITFTLFSEENSNTPLLFSKNFPPYTFPHSRNKGFGLHNIPHNKELLEVENLLIYCKLEYKKDKLEPPVNKYSDLASDIARSLTSLADKDITFVIAGKEIRAHKFILAARSPVFAAMFQNESKEAALSRFSIPDMEPDIFEALLSFLYTDQVDLTFKMSKSLLTASKHYQLDLLGWHCERFLAQELSIENCCDLLKLANDHPAEDLKKDVVSFIRKSSDQVKITNEWQDLKKTRPVLVLEIVDDLMASNK